MVGKSVHYKTNPPPPKCFLPFLLSKKKNLQTIQLYTHKQEAGTNKNKLMGPSKVTRLLTVPKGLIPRTLPGDWLTHSSDPRLTLAKPFSSLSE